MAIDEINAAGGVMGKMLEPIVEDGASDWPTFAEKARKLLQEDQVAVIFGCWTSASRKAVLPVVEENNGLLFYPVQYEGLEESPNIVYTGATTNQQIVPAVQYLLDQGKTKFYLLGSDYVFPRTSNTIIRAQLADAGLEPVGEEYLPLGGTDFTSILLNIAQAQPDVIFNTLNGDSNVAFFKQFTDAGYDATSLPVLSVSIAEEEVTGIGVDNIVGQLTAWNYYETVDTPENTAFVAAFKAATVRTASPATRWKPVTSASTCGRKQLSRRVRPTLTPCAPPSRPARSATPRPKARSRSTVPHSTRSSRCVSVKSATTV